MNCLTCKYAKWEYTNHKVPRINKNQYGVCNYKVSEVDLFKLLPAIKLITGNRNETLRNINLSSTLWYDRIPDTCAVWEAKPLDTQAGD
jgi:hypothetical protein